MLKSPDNVNLFFTIIKHSRHGSNYVGHLFLYSIILKFSRSVYKLTNIFQNNISLIFFVMKTHFFIVRLVTPYLNLN